MDRVSGIVLAGGRSQRMGRPKALLRLGDMTIIERVVAVVAAVTTEVMVIANEPAAYSYLGVRLVADRVPGRGPLAGIHAGLLAAAGERAVVAACDLPFLEEAVLRHLLAASEGYDVTVPVVRGYPEPLVGVYAKTCLPAVEKVLLASERPKVVDLYQCVRVHYVPESELAPLVNVARAFLNVNTPGDWEKALAWV